MHPGRGRSAEPLTDLQVEGGKVVEIAEPYYNTYRMVKGTGFEEV